MSLHTQRNGICNFPMPSHASSSATKLLLYVGCLQIYTAAMCMYGAQQTRWVEKMWSSTT